MNKYILVTGATGNTGWEVVKRLLDKKIPFKAATTNPEKASLKFPEAKNHWIEMDFTNPKTFNQALNQVNKVFLVRPPALANVQKYFVPFIEALKRYNIEQIVFLSLLGAEKNTVVPHHKIEKLILQYNLPHTFLRPSFFMQNLDTTHLKDIQENRDIFIPAGNGKTSFIDVRDIAEIAVKALTEAGHLHKEYPLTGKEALSYYQVAAVFSHILNEKVTYSDPSIFRFAWTMRQRGYQWNYIMVMIGLYTVAKLGKAGTVTDDLSNLLGRDPISINQYVKDYQTKYTNQ